MSIAHHPAFLWVSSFMDSDWSFGHVHALGPSRRLAGFSDLQLRLVVLRPPKRGAVVGAPAFLSAAVSRLLRSIGRGAVGATAFAALRSLAAFRFSAMEASISGDNVASLAFFAAFRNRAASLFAVMRVMASGVRTSGTVSLAAVVLSVTACPLASFPS